MIRFLRSLFAWREVRNTGLNSYRVNEITGARRIVKLADGAYQPADWGWVRTGEWTCRAPPPGVVARDA